MSFDRKADQASFERADRERPAPTRGMRNGAFHDNLLDLQRAAGNQAVGQALRTGPSPKTGAGTQRAPAGATASGPPAPTQTATLQLGAIWESLVVRPLARARERLTRTTPESEAALRDIDTALSGIASVKESTPGGDANRLRLEVLERRVRSFRDLVEASRGRAKSESDIERDMLAWRIEATAFGESLTDPTGDPRPNPIPSEWKRLVVDILWHGQRTFETMLESGIKAYLTALINMDDFRSVVPNHKLLELYRLRAGVQGTLSLLEAMSDTAKGEVVNAGIEAYETADVVGRHLTGKAVDFENAKPGEPAPGGDEPEFTWERPTRPVDNDTVLEHP